MTRISSLLMVAAMLVPGFVANASASSFSGDYTYALTGETTNLSCATAVPVSGNPWTDDFASNAGNNSIAADPVTFSICDGTPGFLEGGSFLITDGGADSATGIFTGLLTGNTLPDNTGGDIFDGTFSITSATGSYAGVMGDTGNFQVVTGAVNTNAFATGTFTFQSAPEPVTTLLAGSGLLLLGLSRKFLKRRA